VIDIISQTGTDFFLTGGTALSRAYYNHRYSDDLDFFVNRSNTFDEQLNKVLAALSDNGFIWSTVEGFTRAENFASIRVRRGSDSLLQLDFVNDTAPFFGEITKTALYFRTDSIMNILSNKLSAIFRYAAKDIADIREIALRESVDWAQAISDARNKDAGVELHYVAQIMTGMPQSEFEKIAWVRKTPWDEFRADIEKIAFDMLHG